MTTEPTAEHTPCCSAHGVPMSCERYRRTHFVEVRPCCAADSARLKAEASTIQISTDEAAIDRAAAALAKPEWWNILPDWVKDQYRDQARAVITALTVP